MRVDHSTLHISKLRTPAAAKYLGLSASLLSKMRLRGDGPVYSKAGPRVVVYDLADLESWLAVRKRTSTSDSGGIRIEDDGVKGDAL